MQIKPAQDTPEIKIIAENFQEANSVFKLLSIVQEIQKGASDRYRLISNVRDILEAL